MNPTHVIVDSVGIDDLLEVPASSACASLKGDAACHSQTDVRRVGIAIHLRSQLWPGRQIRKLRTEAVSAIESHAESIDCVCADKICVAKRERVFLGCLLEKVREQDVRLVGVPP